MHEVEKEVILKYGLNPKNIASFKDAIVFDADAEGLFMLKCTHISPERLKFIYNVKKHIIDNGFQNMDKMLCTLEGEPFCIHNGFTYYLCTVPKGYKCNLDSEACFTMAVSLLARLHKAAAGYPYEENVYMRSGLGQLPNLFQKRMNELVRFKKIAEKRMKKFDMLFLQYFNMFYSSGIEVSEKLKNSNYNIITKKADKIKQICHQNYVQENIIIDDNGEASAINFENCGYNIRASDLADLLRRKMKRCNWDVKTAFRAIEIYRKENTFEKDEEMLVFLLLKFPHRFWRLSSRYYNSCKRDIFQKWYIEKFEKLLEEKKYQEAFEKHIMQ